MAIIKNYKEFLIKEDFDIENTEIRDNIINDIDPKESDLPSDGGQITLYRLTSHSVVDLSAPGEFYVKTMEDVSEDFLDAKGTEYFLITVNCPGDNIDPEKTELECAKHNCECIVAVKDDTQCEIITVEPWKK